VSLIVVEFEACDEAVGGVGEKGLGVDSRERGQGSDVKGCRRGQDVGHGAGVVGR
jgi:hypothetical protein